MEQPQQQQQIDIKTLLATIGELTVVNGLLKQRIAELEAQRGEANSKPMPEKLREAPKGVPA